MSFASFGIGVGAFAKGLQGGMNLGRQINQARDEKEISDVRDQGIEDAKAGREADIDANIERTGLDDRSDFMGDVTTGYKVGDTTYSSPDEAREPASQGVDSVMDRFMRDTAPKVAETYASQGNFEKAEGWNTWLRQRRSRSAIGEWSKAYMAARNGDWDSAASGFGEYYTNYIDDNVDYLGHEVERDGDGNVTGFQIRLLDNDAGDERTMNLSTEDLVDLGVAHNPQTLFELEMQRSVKADEARLETAQDIAKANRDFGFDARLEGIKQTGRLERDQYQADLDAQESNRDVQNKIRMLRDSGYSQQFIDQMMPAIIGIGEYKKQAPPEEVARMIHQERLSASGPYGSYARMSPEEQRELIEKDIEMFYEIGDSYGNRNRAEGSGQSSPAFNGLWYKP